METLESLDFTNGNIELYDDGFEIVIKENLDVTLLMDDNSLIIDEFLQGKITRGEQVESHLNETQAVNTVNTIVNAINETLKEIYESMQESIRENYYFEGLGAEII